MSEALRRINTIPSPIAFFTLARAAHFHAFA
jgi:hypothetical protein